VKRPGAIRLIRRPVVTTVSRLPAMLWCDRVFMTARVFWSAIR
jgi:hypothetical protein